MKRKLVGLMMTGAVAWVLTGCATPRPVVWDYKVISGHLYSSRFSPPGSPPPPPTLGKQLEEATAGGWQVVSVGNDDGLPFVILRKAQPEK